MDIDQAFQCATEHYQKNTSKHVHAEYHAQASGKTNAFNVYLKNNPQPLKDAAKQWSQDKGVHVFKYSKKASS